MRYRGSLCLCIFLTLSGFGQSPKEFGFIAHSFTDKQLGTVNFYVSDTLHQQQKPLLVYLDGSGNYPLFSFTKDSSGNMKRYSTVLLRLKDLKVKYHILLISKPNIPFCVEEKSNMGMPNTDSVYERLASCDWRVEATAKAIESVFANYKVNKRKVVVFGYSEGGQVAPRLAMYNKKITHCIAFVGGGLNQFFDEIIKRRMQAYKGELTAEEAQMQIDSLYGDYKKIYNRPGSTKDYWYGHTYKRWSSYTKIPTIEYLKQLNIPVYIAQGTDDRSTNILSADYIRLEFLRLGKTNLTFKTYSGADHMFTESLTKKSLLEPAVAEALKWVDKQ